MNCFKMLSLATAAAIASIAFAGTAAATTLTSPSGTTYTSTIKASASHLALDTSFFTPITCTGSSIESQIEAHGSSIKASGKVSSLTFTGCGDDVFTVLKPG